MSLFAAIACFRALNLRIKFLTGTLLQLRNPTLGNRVWATFTFYIGADSTGATGNVAPVLTQEPGQTLRFAPVPFMAVL